MTITPASRVRAAVALWPVLFLAPLLGAPAAPIAAGTGERWVVTWGASPQLVEPGNMPPAPGLAHDTLRQVVHVSIGGSRLRVRFSNEFGSEPVTIAGAAIAASAGGSTIRPDTNRVLTFGGRPSITMAPRSACVSDPVAYALAPLSDVAVTVHFDGVSPDVTGHPGSRCTSYLQAGDAVSAVSLPDAAAVTHWYILTGIDVPARDAEAAIAILGDSITDGRGSTTNRNRRWPDFLARRLQANPATAHLAVLNEGIGGNRLLHDGLGPSALSRLDRDVLDQSGVRWLIVLEGVNDIGTSPPDDGGRVVQEVIGAYEQIIRRAHARNLRVYGATILPFGGSFYDKAPHEEDRQAINRWIRTSGAFDAVIDFDAAMRDPAAPTHLRPAFDSGDHLHPADEGYQVMADTIDLKLFAQ